LIKPKLPIRWKGSTVAKSSGRRKDIMSDLVSWFAFS
jgi:hypothetical protein